MTKKKKEEFDDLNKIIEKDFENLDREIEEVNRNLIDSKKNKPTADKKVVSKKKKTVVDENLSKDKEVIETKNEEFFKEKIEESKSYISNNAKSIKNFIEEKIDYNKIDFFKLTTILLTILALILIACLLFDKEEQNNTIVGGETYNMAEVLNVYKDSNTKLSLPENYLLSEDGIVYHLEENKLRTVCTINAITSTEAEFEEAINYYKQSLNLSLEDSINGFKIGKIISNQENATYTYYFLYKDGLFNEFIFYTSDQEVIDLILNNFTIN